MNIGMKIKKLRSEKGIKKVKLLAVNTPNHIYNSKYFCEED